MRLDLEPKLYDSRMLVNLIAVVLLLAGCAHRVCGWLDPASVAAFHQSHQLSIGANESAVEDLAAEPWLVCIEGGVAKIQDHAVDGEEP